MKKPIIVGQTRQEILFALGIGKWFYLPILSDLVTPPKQNTRSAIGYLNEVLYYWDVTTQTWVAVGGGKAFISTADNLTLSQRVGDTLIGIKDQYTGEYVSLNKTTLNQSGAAISDSDVDGVMYFKMGTEYFVRAISYGISVKWYNALASNTAAANNTIIGNVVTRFGTNAAIIVPTDIQNSYQYPATVLYVEDRYQSILYDKRSVNTNNANGMQVIRNPRIQSISGGNANTISGGGITGSEQVISGGGSYNTIGGGYDDQITSSGIGASTIGGGAHHRIQDTATHGTISGGSYHYIKSGCDYGTIAGGTNSQIDDADNATVSGGSHHSIKATGISGTVLGGSGCVVSGNTAMAGMAANVAAGNASSVAGSANITNGSLGVVSGGSRNRTGDANTRSFLDAAVTAGSTTVNVASANFAAGDVGLVVHIQGCGDRFGVHSTTIASVVSASQITVATAPPNTRSAQTISIIGTTGYTGGFIGSGLNNRAGADYAVVSGGRDNTATGAYSVLSGGQTNIASGVQSVVSGGLTNSAAGPTSTVAGGASNTASGSAAVVSGGNTNTASGSLSTVSGGLANSASADYSHVPGGRSNTATQPYSAATGYGASGKRYGEHAQSSGFFTLAGDAQTSVLTQRIITTDATAGNLSLDGSSASIGLSTNSAIACKALIVATRTDVYGESAMFELNFLVRRDTGSVVLVGQSIRSNIYDAAASAWTVSVFTGTASFTIQAFGDAAKTIKWVSRLELSEVLM